METLKIHTGQVCLNIVDDSGESRGVFKFNPNDITVAKRIYSLQGTIADKQKEYEERVNQAEASEESSIELLEEIVQYFRGVIDDIFGAGSSNILFGDACSISMFDDFFEGITPYYQKASEARVQKYKKVKGSTKK